MKIRPAAIPLITLDPFFSVWSDTDILYKDFTKHWTGMRCPLAMGVFVGDKYYTMTATSPDHCPPDNRLYQRDFEVKPTSTEYVFENDEVAIKVIFTSPLLLNRTDILSRPVSYVEYKIANKTDKEVRFLFGISARACSNEDACDVVIRKGEESVSVGRVEQTPLCKSGDHVMIDWGYLHLCDTEAKVLVYTKDGDLTFPEGESVYNIKRDEPYLAVIKNSESGVITLTYDEIYPIEYFGEKLKENYTNYFNSFEDMIKAAKSEYAEIKAACNAFDKEITREAAEKGENYKDILTLAYRQAIAAHKLVRDTDGNILFLSKECHSNGCIGTLDVTYPSIPLFLKYNPELVKGMLRPIIKYAKSDDWKFIFTPHDVGQYPLANGQVYGQETTDSVADVIREDTHVQGYIREDMQMPVEEAGNMLLTLATLKKYAGDTELFEKDKALMKQWADYLVEKGYDPKNQLCTDDFAGHLAHNCNLSLKAILGIAAYSYLSGDTSYMEIAENLANRWEKDAKASHGATRLTFDNADGWSLKYNIVWDSMLGFNLFTDEVKKKEIEFYKTKLNRYGVPLDSRSDYTKLDWLVWSTLIYPDKEYFDLVCESIINMINETPDRVPLADWYYSSSADYCYFRNRSVVGGLFINLL